jgi:hypothetical protein
LIDKPLNLGQYEVSMENGGFASIVRENGGIFALNADVLSKSERCDEIVAWVTEPRERLLETQAYMAYGTKSQLMHDYRDL